MTRRAFVLVVDDSVDTADMLQTLLERHGCRVSVAGDGEGALALCARERPDVVFLDLGLPDIDGYEVGRRLRGLPGMAQCRLVALSGYGQQEHVRKSSEAGFDAHMTKPVDPEALVAQLRPR